MEAVVWLIVAFLAIILFVKLITRTPRATSSVTVIPAKKGNVHARNLINRKDIYLIDTETTGLTEHSVIVEAALCDTTGEIVYHSYYQLPKGARFQEDATRANGLTREKLKTLDAKPFDEEWPKLRDVLRRGTLILSWNAEFEARLLNQTQGKWGVEKDLSVKIEDVQKSFGKWAAMHKTAQEYGISYPETEAHTAKDDARILLEILRAAASGRARISDPPTDRQIAFIESLSDELGIPVNYPDTKEQASEMIDDLKDRRGY